MRNLKQLTFALFVSVSMLFFIGIDRLPALDYGPGSRGVLAQVPTVPAEIRAVATVGMNVADMNQAVDFYHKVLGFQKVSDLEVTGTPYERLQGVFGLRKRVVSMRLGQETIELTEYIAPKGRPIPLDSRSNDLWFQHLAIVVSDMDKAYAWLRQHNVQHVSTGPQTLPASIPAAAGIKAFYFRDPDNHNLELIFFPPDKGNPRWQSPTKDLFLGIDHTAIAVGHTERSLHFYRDLLGLKVTGESENSGTEQEHLNNVFGARLRITGLKGAYGPGIEFLEYLAPPGGRPFPTDIRPNDLVYWQTTLTARNLTALEQRLRQAGVAFLSPGIITLPGAKSGFQRAMVVYDPDGHAIRILEN